MGRLFWMGIGRQPRNTGHTGGDTVIGYVLVSLLFLHYIRISYHLRVFLNAVLTIPTNSETR